MVLGGPCDGVVGDVGGSRQRMRGLEGGRGEEAVGFLDEEVDAAVQAVGGHGVLHQAPDALDGIVLVGAVLPEPEEVEARMLGPSTPGPAEVGGVGNYVV